ncbi:hypothetical protein DBO86_06220 [Pseudomonas indoloxydans]|uniref:Uncharacterized protein n=1 Tax=Ectopseudomonas oleovorans TaxID=301 RepID=A0A2T5PQB5_ECTOL|nr:hypothetical protein [Pseudomonas indoloxydans]PTU79917.1 hypothetical protein DBO86_06220 [Pseudomonas indoloxydans]
MTRSEQRRLWAIALDEYGAEALEQNVLGCLERILAGDLAQELPSHVSAEGLAQLVGILLSNIESGERPLLGELWPLYRQHFLVLRYLQRRLTFSLLSDLPADLVPNGMLRFKAQADFGV